MEKLGNEAFLEDAYRKWPLEVQTMVAITGNIQHLWPPEQGLQQPRLPLRFCQDLSHQLPKKLFSIEMQASPPLDSMSCLKLFLMCECHFLLVFGAMKGFACFLDSCPIRNEEVGS